MNVTEQVTTFLTTLKSQREAGLLVLTNTKDFVEVEEALLKSNFKLAKNWKQVLVQLGESQSTFVYVNGEFTKEYYDLLKQYSERGSMIQIMDTVTMEYETVNFDSAEAHLVFILTKEALGWAEDKFSIRDKAGLMAVIS